MEEVTNKSNDALSPEEMAFIADNLAESAAYLSHLSQLWLEEGDDQVVEDLEIDLPRLSQIQAATLRRKVFGRLQRTNFAAKTVKLGTEGFMQVLLAMVRPLIGGQNKKD